MSKSYRDYRLAREDIDCKTSWQDLCKIILSGVGVLFILFFVLIMFYGMKDVDYKRSQRSIVRQKKYIPPKQAATETEGWNEDVSKKWTKETSYYENE